MVRPIRSEDLGIQILVDNTGNAKDSIDIVAIHGMGAHPSDTWTIVKDQPDGTKTYVNWISNAEMLPKIVPHARIMQYGYESNWFGNNPMNVGVSDIAGRLLKAIRREREDHTNRPLIFICHCFGGLVVLKALTRAHYEQPDWPGLYQSTTGLIFFGTPFRGAGGLSQSVMIAAALSKYRADQVDGRALGIFQAGDSYLHDITEEFGRVQSKPNKTPVDCFYELKSSDVGMILGNKESFTFVVSRESGCLDLSESVGKHSLSRTHFDMHRFSNPTDEDFLTVRDVVKNMVKKSRGLLLARNSVRNEYFLPFNPNPVPEALNFVGREAELAQMSQFFEQNSTNGKGSRKVFALYGSGGIGKTQIAARFVQDKKDQYSAIVWLDGSTSQTVARSLADFATQIRSTFKDALPEDQSDINAVNKSVLGWLAREGNSNWLMIFDNVDLDPESRPPDSLAYNVREYFPQADHGSVLITSQLESMRKIGNSMKINKLSVKESETLAEKYLERRIQGDKDAEKMIVTLDGLPLALAMAGSYIQETGIDFVTYNKFYSEAWSDLAEQQDEYALHDYRKRGILTAWQISYQEIKRQQPDTARLLKLWSCLNNKDLDYSILATSAGGKLSECSEFDWLRKITKTELSFNRSIRLLSRYSLIEKQALEKIYSMHGVLHEWVFHLIQKEEQDLGALFCGLAVRLIANQGLPVSSKSESWSLYRKLGPHAVSVTRRIKFQNANCQKMVMTEDTLPTRACKYVSLILKTVEAFSEAQQIFEIVLDRAKKEETDDSSNVWVAFRLASQCEERGNFKDAEKIYTNIITALERDMKKNGELRLHLLNSLANLWLRQGHFQKTEQLITRTLIESVALVGKSHICTHRTLHTFGSLYETQGLFDEAERMYEQSVLEFAKQPKMNPPLELLANKKLGIIYLKQSRLEKAEEHLHKVLEGFEKLLGSADPTCTEIKELLSSIPELRKQSE